MIYLDNAATTFPKPESVYLAMDEMNRTGAVNAGRGSYKLARSASKLIADTKKQIRDLLHVDISAAVVFSASITMAMNQIVNGLILREGAVVYLSPYEHNAVVRTVYQLAKLKKIKIKEIPLDTVTLEIDMEKVKYEFSKEKPAAVFCTHVSNVTGYILPISDIFSEAKRYGSITILDSAQSLGLIDVNASSLEVDIVAFAGHKTLYGPLGIGGFVNVSGIMLNAFITGGTGSDSLNLEMPDSNESKYEAASSNIVAIAGLHAALKVLNQQELYRIEQELTEYFVSKLEGLHGIHLFIPNDKKCHIGIVSFTVSGLSSEDVGIILDEDFDIAVRTGFHCAPLIHKYLRDEKKLGVVRVGFGQFSTKKDVDILIMALGELIGGY